MNELPHGRGGMRSVYDVDPEQYQRLFDQQILAKEDLIKQEELSKME